MMCRVLCVAGLFLASCSALSTGEPLVAEPARAQSNTRAIADEASLPAATARESAVPTLASADEPAALAEVTAMIEPEPSAAFGPAQGESLHGSRFTIKAGVYSAEDADELDDGFIANVSWTRYFTKLFAAELEIGYFDADGEEGGVDAEVFAIPVMANARFNIPIWILDAYAGAGVGTFYYDAEVDALGQSDDDDGFLLGGNAFVGASINLADRIALGLEGKYYLSEDIDDFDFALDAFAVMVTLGFSR